MPLSAIALLCAFLLVLALLAQAQSLINSVLRLLSWRAWSPLVSICSRSEFPPQFPPQLQHELAQQAILHSARNEMRAAGFVYTHTRRYRDLFYSQQDLACIVDVYYHPERDVHAQVLISSCPQAGRCYEIELSNSYIDMSSVLTVWRGSARMLLCAGKCSLVRARFCDVHNLLQAHLRRRQHIASVRTVASDSLQIARTWSERGLLWLAHEGRVVPTKQRHAGRDLFRLSFTSACQLAWQDYRAACWRKFARLESFFTRTASIKPNADDAALLVQARQCQLAQQWAYAASAQPLRGFALATMLLTTAGLLAASYWLGGLIGLASVALVLAWHAVIVLSLHVIRYAYQPWRKTALPHPLLAVLGHLLAPALGILLACGMVAAIVFGLLPVQASVLWFVCWCLLFNLLQLLPLRPFLGGQILDLLSAWTLPRMLLLLLAAGAALLAGVYASRPALLLLAGLLLLCVPRLWRQIRARALMQRAQSAPSANYLPHNLLTRLAASRWSSNAGRIALVNTAATLSRKLGATASVVGLGLYATCAMLPLLLVLSLLLRYPTQSMAIWQQSHAVLASKTENPAVASHSKANHDNKLARTKTTKDLAKDGQRGAHPTVHMNPN